MRKKTVSKQSQDDTALVVQEVPKQELILEGDPKAQLEFAKKAADALMEVVNRKQKPVIINGQTYLEYGDWQTLARFFGCTVGVEWTKAIGGGWESRAVVYRNGMVISAAEAMCTRDERNWKNRDEFMLRSMAQTRASAKALRNAVGWVAELAGYSATPAEEMDGVQKERVHYEVKSNTEEESEQFMNREEVAEVKKERIKQLLVDCGKDPKGQSYKAIQMDIRLLTGGMKNGIMWHMGQNDDDVIHALEKKSPIEQIIEV